jgi:hypothetical protein
MQWVRLGTLWNAPHVKKPAGSGLSGIIWNGLEVKLAERVSALLISAVVQNSPSETLAARGLTK